MENNARPEPIGFSREKAREVLERHNLDVLVASTPVNVFYATGLPTLHVAPNPILYVLANQFPTLALIRRDGEECAFTWMVYQSTGKWTWVEDVTGTLSPRQTMEEAVKKLESWGGSPQRIGLESLMPRYQSEFIREKIPGAEIVDGDRAFLDMRLVKTAEEIRRIRRSTEIAEQAILGVMDAAGEGVTDHELLKAARRIVIDQGAEGWDHLTMGLGASDPEAPGLGYRVNRGEINRIDIGAVFQGYVSDVSRQFAVGALPEGATEHMELMIRVQEFLEQGVRPGVQVQELHGECRKFAKSLVKRGFIHATAHSIGLECEEVHLFSPMRVLDIAFAEGMVLDLEVWRKFGEFNLVGIEDCYQVTAGGLERISRLDKRIFLR